MRQFSLRLLDPGIVHKRLQIACGKADGAAVEVAIVGVAVFAVGDAGQGTEVDAVELGHRALAATGVAAVAHAGVIDRQPVVARPAQRVAAGVLCRDAQLQRVIEEHTILRGNDGNQAARLLGLFRLLVGVLHGRAVQVKMAGASLQRLAIGHAVRHGLLAHDIQGCAAIDRQAVDPGHVRPVTLAICLVGKAHPDIAVTGQGDGAGAVNGVRRARCLKIGVNPLALLVTVLHVGRQVRTASDIAHFSRCNVGSRDVISVVIFPVAKANPLWGLGGALVKLERRRIPIIHSDVVNGVWVDLGQVAEISQGDGGGWAGVEPEIV